jgi:FdhD protein
VHSRARDSATEARIWRVEAGRTEAADDRLATEEPLEIRLRWGAERSTVAVTMRTPGADAELAAGFLFCEGVVADRARIRRVVHLFAPGEEPSPAGSNVVEVELEDGPPPALQSLERHFFATSACGVCGKAGLEALRMRVPGPLPPGPEVAPEVLRSLPDRLRAAQGLFDATGGLHAAALFDAAGSLLAVREDVGRHNAVDKLVGWALAAGKLPLHGHVVLVSGRSSYEILQKCAVAGVPFVCAVSAPSSLAVELAERFGVTLIGFLRGDRFNVYSGLERVEGAAPEGFRAPRRRAERAQRLFPTFP